MCSVPRSHVAPPPSAGMMMRSVVMTGHCVIVIGARLAAPEIDSLSVPAQCCQTMHGRSSGSGRTNSPHLTIPAFPALPALVPIVLWFVRSFGGHAEVVGL